MARFGVLLIFYLIICLTYGLNNNHIRSSQRLLQPSDDLNSNADSMRFAESELGWIEKLKAKKSSNPSPSNNNNNNNNPAPSTNAPTPSTNAPAPSTNTPAPSNKNNKGTSPSTSTPAPSTNAPAPSTNTPAPSNKNNKGTSPSTSTPAPSTNAPAPSTNTPAPSNKNNKGTSPSTSTQAPATNTPAPSSKNNKGTSPSTSTQAPATNTPAPSNKNNKGTSPSTSTQAPATNTPAPSNKNNKGASPSATAPSNKNSKTSNPSTSTQAPVSDKSKKDTTSSSKPNDNSTKGKGSNTSSNTEKTKNNASKTDAPKDKGNASKTDAPKGKGNASKTDAPKGKGNASKTDAPKGKGNASKTDAPKGKGNSANAKGKGNSANAKGKGNSEQKATQSTQSKAQPAAAASSKPVHREFRIQQNFDEKQVDKTKSDLQKSLCDALGPEKCAGVRVISLASGSILVMCEFSQAGSVTSNSIAEDVVNMIKDPNSKLRKLPLWSNVDPSYIKDPDAPPTTSNVTPSKPKSSNRGPVPVENAARDDSKSRASLEKIKSSPQDVGGSCKINRIVEMGEAVCQQLLCVDATIRSNLDCNILSARLGKAETIASDMVVTGAISAPSGTLIINSELMMTQTDFSATAFIAEDVVISGVKQWKLVHHDDFEDGSNGWSLLETSSCTGRDHFLGGHCNLGTGKVTKTYDKLPPHKQIRVTARYHFIDKWNGETAFLEIDKAHSWVHRHKSSSQGINMCGGSHPEEKMSAPIDVVQAHSSSLLQLSFGSSGNPEENPCERSFGVDDVMVYVR